MRHHGVILLKEGDPAIISQKYGCVVPRKHKDNMYVSIYQGFTLPVKSLAKGLNNTIVMFLFLLIDYLIASPLIFQCLANLHWSTKPGLTWRPDTFSNETLY